MLKSLVPTLLILVALPCFVVAQSPMGAPMVSPAPGQDCLTAVANVSDCLTYVQQGSNMTVPDKPCCPEFAGLLESNAICLCQLIENPEDLGIDISRALMLPSICKVPVPPISSCPGGAPVPAPSSSEAPGSSASTIPDGEAAAGPASGNGGSAASSIVISGLSTLVCLAVASFAAFLLI